MNRRGRLVVLALSLPIIAFALVGGFMGRVAAARQESYQALRIFEDVVGLITSNYVEEVDLKKVMRGAMHGLADGLDPDSAYLDAAQVGQIEKNVPLERGQVGLEITRQYYLRVIAARDGSPAAKAGLRPGDYIRGIDGQSTRDTSVHEGRRLLAGKHGTTVRLTVLRGNAAEPHEIELRREELPPASPSGRIVATGTGYLRVPEFSKATPDQITREAAALAKAGASRLVVDVRGAAFGDVELGLAAARVFVRSGTLAYRQERGKEKDPIAAAPGDGTLTMPVMVLVDNGTSGPAELFASALAGNKRAEVVGERTAGRASRQKLIKLPDGSGLLLTHLLYLAPGGGAISEKGLVPDIAVEQPDFDFGQPPPSTDPILDRAIDAFTGKKAA
jgi:carboxyl-terminal processing protease